MDRERRGSFIDQITNLASQMLPVLDVVPAAPPEPASPKPVGMSLPMA